MDTCNRKTRVGGLLAIAAAGVVGMMLQSSAQAANIYLDAALITATPKPIQVKTALNEDETGYSSFNNTTTTVNPAPNFWVGGGAPVAGTLGNPNNYFAERSDGTAYAIRTPGGGTGPYVFAGDSLTLTKTGSILRYKSPANSTVSVNLVMKAGSSIDSQSAAYNYTLAGTLNLNGNATITGVTTANPGPTPPVTLNVFTVNSDISGSAVLTLNGAAINTDTTKPPVTTYGNFAIGGDNSAFSGTINVNRPVELTSSNAIGGGTLYMASSANTTVTLNSALALGSGTLSVQNTAATSISNSVILNFTSDIGNPSTMASVGHLKFGLTTYDSGIFGAIPGATQLYINNDISRPVFTGTGLLIVPEPATMGLVSLCGLAMLRRRKA